MTAEPRDVEEIRSPADIDHLVEQLSVQNFRPIRGELYAALSELRDHRAEVERLSAELADARAEVERYAELAQRFEGDAEAAERALEAVRALAEDWRGTHWANDVHERSAGFADDIRAALSAASPTTSDDEPISMVECNFHGHAHAVGWVGCVSSRRAASEAETCEAIARQIEQQIPDLTFDDGHTTTATDEARMLVKRQAAAIARGPAAASDEPARCPHGHAEAHTIPVHLAGFGCSGPAASGTPETTR